MFNYFFSVVTSAYNAEEFIQRAVDSVLMQNYDNFEYVVVDNGSNDSTLELLLAYQNRFPEKVKVFHVDDNMGISGGRNFGFLKTKGDYVCFLDADDYWEYDKLFEVNKAINEKQDFNIFCHWEYHKTSDNSRIVEYRQLNYADQFLDLLLNGNCLSTSAIVIKRDILKKENGFNIELTDGEEDYDLWLRLVKDGGRVYMIRKVLGSWIIRNDSKSSNVIRHTEAVANLLKQHCDIMIGEKTEKSLKNKCKKAIAACYCSAGRALSKNGDRRMALKFFKKALNSYSLYIKAYAGIILNAIHM